MAETNTPLLAARGLLVGYDGHAILPPIEVEIRTNQLWALVGRNGSGKTTLLRTLLGLLPRVHGEIVPAPNLKIGYTPQRESIDETVPARVRDIVASGLDRDWDFLIPFLTWRRRDLIEKVMADTNVQHLAKRQFSQLSIGQKQRVLQARLLASRPQLMVLDEPTSAMDAVAERETFARLDELRAERRLSMLVVSHHLEVLVERATHILAVDQDQQLMVAGPVMDVLADPDFCNRYGEAFVARLVEAHQRGPISNEEEEPRGQEAPAEEEAQDRDAIAPAIAKEHGSSDEEAA